MCSCKNSLKKKVADQSKKENVLATLSGKINLTVLKNKIKEIVGK